VEDERNGQDAKKTASGVARRVVYGTRVNGEFFLLVPDAEYTSTTVYSLDDEGSASERWTIPGWSNRLFELE
jgi:hypothetical protein